MAQGLVASSDTGLMKLKGEIIVERANELKKILLDAFGVSDSIVLDIEEVTGADLSGLQILCAAHRMAMRSKKTLAFKGIPAGALTLIIEEAGFTRTLGCHNDPDKSCLWSKGEWGL